MRAAPHCSVLLLLVLAASNASARNDFRDITVRSATTTQIASEKLLDLPFYMAGQAHRSIARDLGQVSTNRRTNAFNKSDEYACQIAFLSAIIALQRRAREMGGDAVVDVRSITKHNDLESPTRFRCAVGNVVANVALTARVVTLR
jgi:uncharacterized protein YbjQ (UPF0145 family)